MKTPKPLVIPAVPDIPRPKASLAEKLAVTAPAATMVTPRLPKPIDATMLPVEERVRPKAPKPRSRSDELLEWVEVNHSQIKDPTMLRGRIDWLLAADKSAIMGFGERNLAPLRTAADRQAVLAARLSEINATQWIRDTQVSSCKPPSFFGRFSDKTPEWYQAKLRQVKTELQALLIKIDADLMIVEPEMSDLLHDVVAIQAVKTGITEPVLLNIVDRRERTLLGGQQNLALLVMALKTAIVQCSDHSARIDDLLNITIPAWIMANRVH